MQNIDKNLLVVARWPLGGIRTYLSYMLNHFPERYRLTLLAASTHEDAALQEDAKGYRARLVLVNVTGLHTFVLGIFKELRCNRYDLILSQGFVSAVAVYFANLMFKIPHVLTIHGIVESRFLKGRFGFLKRWLLGRVLAGVTVLYGVSNDILEHLYEEFPHLRNKGPKQLVILNGIEPSDFDLQPAEAVKLREQLNIDPSVFIFGFFGRFMPQKGFDLIIEAVNAIRKQLPNTSFTVVAVGSGDYIGEYKATIRREGLQTFFYFLPFQPMVYQLYPQVDVIVMPSRWEASGLLAMEALCMGTPLIASNCIGLRETVVETPVSLFQSENLEQLIETMMNYLKYDNRCIFREFAPTAHQRFDVAHSAKRLVEFIDQLLEGR